MLLAFGDQVAWSIPNTPINSWVLANILDAVFLFDVIIKARTSFQDHGYEVTDGKKMVAQKQGEIEALMAEAEREQREANEKRREATRKRLRDKERQIREEYQSGELFRRSRKRAKEGDAMAVAFFEDVGLRVTELAD